MQAQVTRQASILNDCCVDNNFENKMSHVKFKSKVYYCVCVHGASLNWPWTQCLTKTHKTVIHPGGEETDFNFPCH